MRQRPRGEILRKNACLPDSSYVRGERPETWRQFGGTWRQFKVARSALMTCVPDLRTIFAASADQARVVEDTPGLATQRGSLAEILERAGDATSAATFGSPSAQPLFRRDAVTGRWLGAFSSGGDVLWAAAMANGVRQSAVMSPPTLFAGGPRRIGPIVELPIRTSAQRPAPSIRR